MGILNRMPHKLLLSGEDTVGIMSFKASLHVEETSHNFYVVVTG